MSKPIIVKYKKDGHNFEILTHHGKVEPYKEGTIGWSNVPYIEAIFKDSAKGDRYTDFQLKESFGTSSIEECMKIIVDRGELQLTSEDRKKKKEELKRKIINEIHKYYLDPKTMKSHPITTLESAIERTKINITLEKGFQRQFDEIVKKLPEFIPIRKCVMEGTLTIPNTYIGKAQGVISKFAEEGSKKYLSTHLEVQVSVIPGVYDNFMKELSSATKGEALFEINSNSKSSSSNSNLEKGKVKVSKKELKQQKKKSNRQNKIPKE